MVTRHTTEADGSRIDIKKTNPSWASFEIEFSAVDEDGDGAVGATVPLHQALPEGYEVDGTRDLTTETVAAAVAHLLERMDIETDRLIQAKVNRKQTVRSAYGPSREHYDFLDGESEEVYDEAAAERAERYRRANGGGD